MTTKPVILAVDDDPQVLAAIGRDLRRHYGKDYRVVRAESGDAGLEVLDELELRGDAVALLLSDQRMPRMEGVEFLSRALERFPESKRALLTAYADTEAAISAINRSQVDYYLLKPWDPPEEKLYPVLDELLDDWRASFRPGYAGARIVGDRWSADTHRLKDFLARNQVPYRFLDVESNTEAQELALRVEGDRGRLPLVLTPAGELLESPSNAELAQAIGLETQARSPFYDLAIIGAGPAGLASAVYGGSEGLRTVLLEGEATGGQAGTSSRIENYLGFPSGLTGAELARRAAAQARKFEVEVLIPQEVVGLHLDGPYRHLALADGGEIACHALMLSMGVSWRRLPATGAEELAGRGVYYGAAMTEAMSCKGDVVYIVGAGNSAGQAAMYFTQFASKVIMLLRGHSLAAKMSQYLVDRLLTTDNFEVRYGIEVSRCHGESRLERLTLRELASGESEEVAASFLFVFIGAVPRTEWLRDVVALDERGFILTGKDLTSEHLRDWPLEREPFLLETSIPGVFAAGDVRHASIKRVASAVGEGSVAVAFMHQHLASL